jgi:CRP/FNR family transcriptional regulator
MGLSPFFGGLPGELIESLASLGLSQTHGPGQTIFGQGDKALGFYMVASGQAKVYLLEPNGKERVLHLCGPGDVFGAAAVFNPGGYPASAEAVKQTETILLPSQGLKDLMARNPDFSLALFAAMAQKLIELKKMIEGGEKRPLPRLAGFIMGLPAGANAPVKLPATKAKLALHLGMTAESLSRALSRLKAAGLIEEGKAGLRVIDPARLAKIASGEASL